MVLMGLPVVSREKTDEEEAGEEADESSTAVLSVEEAATILTVFEEISCLYCLSQVLRNV